LPRHRGLLSPGRGPHGPLTSFPDPCQPRRLSQDLQPLFLMEVSDPPAPDVFLVFPTLRLPTALVTPCLVFFALLFFDSSRCKSCLCNENFTSHDTPLFHLKQRLSYTSCFAFSDFFLSLERDISCFFRASCMQMQLLQLSLFDRRLRTPLVFYFFL